MTKFTANLPIKSPVNLSKPVPRTNQHPISKEALQCTEPIKRKLQDSRPSFVQVSVTLPFVYCLVTKLCQILCKTVGCSPSTPQLESINSLAFSLLYGPILTSIHDYGKSIALTRQTFVSKVMSLLFKYAV